jgi:hypothetical protein
MRMRMRRNKTYGNARWGFDRQAVAGEGKAELVVFFGSS